VTQGLEPFAIALAAGTIRSGTPVLYAALGEVVTERSGIVNLGLEGIMLIGAWVAVAVSFTTGQVWLALLAALFAGALLGLMHGVLCIQLRANQMATGVAMTIFGSGVSAYFGIPYVGKKIAALSTFSPPVLGTMPMIGPAFFSHDILVYCSYALVPLVAGLLFRTRLGLSIIAAGHDPHAAAAAGVRVEAVRYFSTCFGAALAGVGGAYLSLVFAQGWVENITVGRGLIAVGLVIFARWNPWRSVLGAWLFGGSTALQLRLQAMGTDVSPYLLGMIPYLLVGTVLVGSSIRRRGAQEGAPAALAGTYIPQG
jgi:ABC-type uncharacterized transport system permease subunit